jgi:hypothetical protein
MERKAVSGIPELSRRKAERNSSIGGFTHATADSTPASSAMSERNPEPIGRNDIQVEMAMMMQQRIQKEGRGDPHFPSAASLGSSIWSSSGGNSVSGSEDSDSYAWSASLNSNSEDFDSDYSASSYSGSDVESSSDDEEEDQDKVAPMAQKSYPQPPPGMMGFQSFPQPPPGMTGGKSYPQPPPRMMEGLPLGMGGLPLSLASLKKDLEKVGRAILSSNAGEMAVERAQTLASINWLASHVPNAVLDQLGHETRAMVAAEGVEEEEPSDDESRRSRMKRRGSIVESDAMSDVSDLSQEQHLNENQFEEFAPLTDVADAANVTHSYGDLANLTQPLGANEHGRPPSTIGAGQVNNAEELLGGIPELLSPKSKKAKGMKGIFKRLTKRKGAPKGLEAGLPLLDDPSDGESEALDDEEGSQISVSIGESSKSASKEMEAKPKIRGKRLPYSSDYRCSLLFVDISGFTKLSTKLDPEALSKVRRRMRKS